jgi:LmbE family N-acetylglucosaminyl deacetylase
VLDLTLPRNRLSVLCLGAHSDDIEIGVGGTLLSWIEQGIELDVLWCVLSAAGARAAEARAAATTILLGAKAEIELLNFQDGYFGYRGAELKDWFESLKTRVKPDIIFTHIRNDAHQDHREVSQLTWNSFRDHLILEYEVPKWDGDVAQTNAYVPLLESVLERKIDILMANFGTQRSKDWFDATIFRGRARMRGMECRAPQGFAEAFVMRKVKLCGHLMSTSASKKLNVLREVAH